MKNLIKQVFFPHADNNHKPLISTGRGVAVVTALSLILLILTSIQIQTLRNSDYFLGAVLPSVLIDLSNNDRVDAGLSPLFANPLLKEAAQRKADHMATNGYFAHVSPDGTTPWYWIDEVGYEFKTAGENLAVHFTDSKEVEEAWMNSPLHRDNILNQNYTEIGIATAEGTYEGHNTIFVVQMFATPRTIASASVGTPSTELGEPVFTESIQTPDESDVAGVRVEESFVTLARQDDTEVTIAISEQEEVKGYSDTRESTLLGRVVSQPITVLQVLYSLLSLILLTTLLLMLISEAREKHLKHVGYVAFSLAMVLLLLFVVQPFIFTDVAIARI